MNLLIITQKVDVNDDNLGFFHRWIEKFAEKLDKVYVICLSRGEYNLPQNVHVFSMGKESGVFKIGQLILLQKHLLKILPNVDGVFIHMCPIYAIASYPFVKIFRKKMILWFLHKHVGWKLRLSEKLVDGILTASEESCRLKNKRKIKIVGHGIDVERFKPAASVSKNNEFIIFSAGRIAPSKDLKTLVEAADILIKEGRIPNLKVKIAGNPITKPERVYLDKIKELIRKREVSGNFEFLGGVPNYKMPEYYQKADIFVNLSHTGSIDKVVLEAMACDTPVLTCNEAFKVILDKRYIFNKKDPQDLAEKIIGLRQGKKEDASLREVIVRNYNLDDLIKKILAEFKNG